MQASENPFGSHPTHAVDALWGRRARCRVCGFTFVWGDDDIDFCEHLDDLQPDDWLARGLVEVMQGGDKDE